MKPKCLTLAHAIQRSREDESHTDDWLYQVDTLDEVWDMGADLVEYCGDNTYIAIGADWRVYVYPTQEVWS
jgi:hypothetical protein